MKISFFSGGAEADLGCDLEGMRRVLNALKECLVSGGTELVLGATENDGGFLHFVFLNGEGGRPQKYVLSVEFLGNDLHMTFSDGGLECFLDSLEFLLRELERNESDHAHFFAEAWGLGFKELTNFSFVDGGRVADKFTVYGLKG